jgi:DNA-binding NarL/FixJ family response regulator
MDKLLSTEIAAHQDLGLPDLVWVKGTSVASMGLTTALEREFRVHRGPLPPPAATAESPSVAICCLEGSEEQEDVASLVRTTKAEVPEAAVLVLSPSLELLLICSAVAAGARGFLHTGAPPRQLTRAISVVLRGEMALPRDLLKAWVDWLDEQQRVPDLSSLSERKLEILELALKEGLSNAQIAKRLYLSVSTVKHHLRVAYKALGAKNRREARRIVRQVQQAL